MKQVVKKLATKIMNYFAAGLTGYEIASSKKETTIVKDFQPMQIVSKESEIDIKSISQISICVIVIAVMIVILKVIHKYVGKKKMQDNQNATQPIPHPRV